MGGGSSVPPGALCQINVAQVLVGRSQARIFSCHYNAIFGKVGRVASEEVVLELVRPKCKYLPMLLYGVRV